jgi:hypothetical protein
MARSIATELSHDVDSMANLTTISQSLDHTVTGILVNTETMKLVSLRKYALRKYSDMPCISNQDNCVI